MQWKVASLTEFRSVLKIVVPDEMHGSIITKTLPVRPNMTTRDVCKIIAHKVRITNPQDYGLFKLVDGEGWYKLFSNYYFYFFHCKIGFIVKEDPVQLEFVVYWHVIPCVLVLVPCLRGACSIHLKPEGGSHMFLWNIRNLLPDFIASHPRRQNCS